MYCSDLSMPVHHPQVLTTSDDLKTSACCTAGAPPPLIRDALKKVGRPRRQQQAPERLGPPSAPALTVCSCSGTATALSLGARCLTRSRPSTMDADRLSPWASRG